MLDLKHISGPGDAFVVVPMLLACLLFGAYPIIKMIGWIAEGSIDLLAGIVSIFLFVVLTIWATLMPPAIAFFILILFAGFALSVPFFGKISDDFQLKQMDKEKVDNYCRVLEQEPMNHAARTGLAEALHKRGEPGDVDLAIQHMEWVLQQSPQLSFRYKPLLDSWKRQRERDQGEYLPPVICHRCHAENAWNATSCENCAAAFGTKTGVMQQVNYQGGPKVVIRGWIVTASTVVLAFFLLLVLPSIIAGPIILASVIVAAWLFLRWVGGNMGTIGD